MVFDLILMAVLVICSVTDLKYQKIYNKIIFPSLIISVLLHVVLQGFDGLKLSMTGFFIGLSLLLIPYLLGGIGAGDVKLLALIGAIKGGGFVLNTALYMALMGGAIAFVIIICQKEFVRFMKGLGLWIFSLLSGIKYRLEFPTNVLLKKYPYGVAIAGGALFCLVFKGAWII